MSKRTRVLTVLLAVAVMFAMLSSALYIAVEADHDCTGEDCRICYQIAVCVNTLKSFGQAVLVLVFAAFAVQLAVSLIPFAYDQAYHASLITLKVKLSN